MSLFNTLFNSFKSGHKLDFHGLTEWHCHILPGVDDGVENMDESLAILSEYERMGIESVWLTPHIMEDVPNTTDQLRTRFEELKNAYKGHIRLRLASENMIDKLFLERLDANDLLPIGDKQNMLLVETSYFSPPMNLHGTIERIKSKGYYPVIAHPERYNYIDSLREYEKLKDLGAKFQLNLLSLSGHYGRRAHDKSHDMLRKGMYDMFGSDLHRLEQLESLNQLSLPTDLSQSLQKIRIKIR